MFRKPRFMLIAALLLTLVPGLHLAQAQGSAPLGNADILKLQKAGLSDDLIVSTINGSPGKYSTSTDDLISLKKAGVSDRVVGAMMMKNSGAAAPAAAAPAAGSAAPVDEVGIYYKDKDGKWVAMLPEIVNFKTGGVLKNLASGGIVKGDINGHIDSPKSQLDLNSPVTLLIYAPEGTAPTEYQLLHLHQNSSNREFRSVTGGVVHVSGGAGKDQIPFTSTKIALRSYQVVLPPGTVPGEYGVLPPGSNTSSNTASAGKIYTFHLAE